MRKEGKAEALARATSPAVEVQGKDPLRSVHELDVHQIELTLHNEDLRRTSLELEVSRDRYLDLYEFSPVGYFTFSREGRIMEVNLTGATLLGTPRNRLIGSDIGIYIAPEDRGGWKLHLASVVQSASTPFGQGERDACDLKLQRTDGSVFHAHLESVRLNRADQQDLTGAAGEISIIRTVMSDVSERVRGELAMRQAHEELEVRVKKRTAEMWETNQQLCQEIEVRRLAEQHAEPQRHAERRKQPESGKFRFHRLGYFRVLVLQRRVCRG